MDVTAICERAGGWWAVRVPEVKGGFTQAKRLDQVPAMVADLVELATGTPAAEVRVSVQPQLRDGSGMKLWHEAADMQERARALQVEAAMMSRVAIAELRDEGLTVRDVATLLQVSPQRVSQLAADKDHPAHA